MKKQTFQHAELRDEHNEIIQEGTYGKYSDFSNEQNSGFIDYVMNNLEWLRRHMGGNGETNFTDYTFKIGNVTKGAEPKITSRIDGTTIFMDFVLPQGEKGEQGLKGDKGEKGDTPSLDGYAKISDVEKDFLKKTDIPKIDLTGYYNKAETDKKLKKIKKINNNSDVDKFFDWLKERNYNLKNFKGLEKTFPILTFATPKFNQPKIGESVIHGTGSPNTIIEFDGKKYEVDDNGNWAITSSKPFEKGIGYKLNYYDYADKLNTLNVVAISEKEKYSIPPKDNVTVVIRDIVDKYDLKDNVILPPTVIVIDTNAFKNNQNIKSVKSLSAKIIGDTAFWDCTNLTSVSFPSAKTISGTAFGNCKKLKTIIINEELSNLDFYGIAPDCIIYNQDKTKKFNINSKQWENV